MVYKVSSSEVSIDGESFVTYGIECDVSRIDDIDTDRSKIEALVKLCNQEQLEPVHLMNVVEDFLIG